MCFSHSTDAFFTHPAVRRNETGNADQSCIGKKPSHLSNAPNVLLAVLWAETQVFVQTLTNIVPIQCVAGDTVAHKVLLQSHTHCGFPCTGQTFAWKESTGLFIISN